MWRTKIARGQAARKAGERPVVPTSFPRWVTIPFVLIIGLILWIGVLSDSSGHLTIPATGSIVYVVGVIVISGLLAYADRKRR